MYSFKITRPGIGKTQISFWGYISMETSAKCYISIFHDWQASALRYPWHVQNIKWESSLNPEKLHGGSNRSNYALDWKKVWFTFQCSIGFGLRLALLAFVVAQQTSNTYINKEAFTEIWDASKAKCPCECYFDFPIAGGMESAKYIMFFAW